MSLQKTTRKIWHFIWEENSVWSWLANIILAFILIKFIIYPAIGFALGTQYPIVAVVSGSMEHKQEFNKWWNTECCTNQQCTQKKTQTENYQKWNINKQEYTKFPYTSGFNKGDIMILTSPNNIKIGDVIVFTTQTRTEPIIHRLASIKTEDDKTYYNTQGDNNCGTTAEFEKNITQQQILGKAYIKIPLLGWIKIAFVELLKTARLI